MGVGEDDGVELRNVDGQRGPIPPAQFLEPLEQPALDEPLVRTIRQMKFGTGDRFSSTEKLQSHAGSTSPFHALGWHPSE